MNILCLLVCIAGCTAGGPAAASWLRCSASGTDRSGEFADFTTVVDVGAITQAQRQAMQQRLVTYVTKVDPEASGVHGECSVSDDQVQAAAIYSRTWNAAAHRLGWTRLSLVSPTMWLSDSEIKSDDSGF